MLAAMAESQVLSVIRMWAAIAWADGILAPAEADGLIRLIRAAELTADEREAAMQFVNAPVGLPETYLTSLTPAARRGIYRAGCRIALVDHEFTPTERRMLDHLREQLGLDEEAAREIEAAVPGLS